MSTVPSVSSSARQRPAARASAGGAAAQAPRARHTPGGAGLGQQASGEARRLAAAILEVLAGARTPRQAAQALGVSLPRYYQLETRALQALVAGCESRPRGPSRTAEKELLVLKRQQERLERELGRQQTLVRLAQRTLGLSPPRTEPAKPGGKGQRRRRAVVRALQAARHLQEPSPAPAVAASDVVASTEGTS
jgi:hypothetical protein